MLLGFIFPLLKQRDNDYFFIPYLDNYLIGMEALSYLFLNITFPLGIAEKKKLTSGFPLHASFS